MTPPLSYTPSQGAEPAERPIREVQVNARVRREGPISWGKMSREGGVKSRTGHGKTGLVYILSRAREWRVVVLSTRGREVEVGTARLQDHAMALAAMWEQAVASGRVDMS